jgi:hypothetical protein
MSKYASYQLSINMNPSHRETYKYILLWTSLRVHDTEMIEDQRALKDILIISSHANLLDVG